MSSLSRETLSVYTVPDLPKDRVYALCRLVSLPDEGSVEEGVRAVQGHYWTHTGKELPVWDAIRILDRVTAERFDVPFPAAYGRIADLLLRGDYSPAAVHLIVAHLRRGGAVGTCPHLEADDRATVAGLLPRDADSCRCRIDVTV